MNTSELKKELIYRISRIEDFDFLNALKTILDHKGKASFIELTDEQEKELLSASEEGINGKLISQTEMDRKVEEWLKEK